MAPPQASQPTVPHSTVRGSIPSTRLGEAAGQTVAVLQFIDGLLAGHTVALHGPTTVGRGRDATVVVPAAERAVSATHCRIRRTASGLWVLEDADSRGGTFLNRERLGPGARPVLGSGDVIGLGAGGPTVIFTLQSPEHAAAQATELYAVTLARVTAEAIERHRFVDRPLVLLGRDRDCDVRFDPRGERAVSKRHARIRYAGRGFVIEDTGSAAGTLHNGVRLGAPGLLRIGDVIELGAGGPRLVVESLEGVDELDAQRAVAVVGQLARRSGRRALLAAGIAVVIATIASLAAWWSSRNHTEAVAAELERRSEARELPPPSSTERFQALARRHGAAVLLLHARFHIEVAGIHDAAHPFFAGDSFGSAFVVSPGGLAITNRHVVEPWLGEPEYADALARARDAFGADAVTLVSSLSAWPADSQLLDEHGELARDRGFDTERGNLEIVGFPPLHRTTVPFDQGTVELVASDHADLALLRLRGAAIAADAIPPLLPADVTLEPLQPVVGLGFPAGRALLEGTLAKASPTLGEVRKVESTIQLSMPTFPGNSGGPVLDVDGRVVGVTTRRFGEGVAVCIPIERVRALLLRLGLH